MPRRAAANNWYVSPLTSTAHIFGWAAEYARSQNGLDNLYILCHGQSGILYLGNPGLTINNIAAASSLKDSSTGRSLVAKMYLFACNPAAGAEGMRFCGRLAVLSGADVIASSEVQDYNCNDFDESFSFEGAINFGPWEGNVYRFSHVDGQGTIVIRSEG
jgi:hypothetical protein